jgi:ABC-type Fe3+-hydroxamate transport system substrate-binding protein
MKKVRFSTIAVIAITGLAVLALAGCGSTTGTAGGRITATDDAGKTISLDAPAERIEACGGYVLLRLPGSR